MSDDAKRLTPPGYIPGIPMDPKAKKDERKDFYNSEHYRRSKK